MPDSEESTCTVFVVSDLESPRLRAATTSDELRDAGEWPYLSGQNSTVHLQVND